MKNTFFADEGYYFIKADRSAVYENVLILGCNDKPENYLQIPIEEAKALKEQLRAEALKRNAKSTEIVAQKNEK